MMRMKKLLAAVALTGRLFVLGGTAHGAPRKPDVVRACVAALDPHVWLVKTGGIWRQGDRYGHLRVVVQRKGIEHAIDWVQVQILESDDKAGEQRTRACLDLETPGLKGYVNDVTFTKIDDTHVAVGLDLEMKAMNGLALREIYVVDTRAPAAKRVIEAKSIELD
jgi:hypothetical protein